MTLLQTFAAITGAAALTVVVAAAPPRGSEPLVQIVEQLEQQGYGPFTEVSFDDGYWEIEAYKGELAYELAVDAGTGKVLSEHRDDAERRPPREALALSQVLRSLTSEGYTRIEEVEFERRYWEIEALRNDGKHEILVNPTSGEVINDRLDD